MLIPTIQTNSIEDVQAKLDAYAAIDLVDKPTHFQIDINDGMFSEHTSVQPNDLQSINWHAFTHEYHLLVDYPDEYLGDVATTGATTIIAHIEHMHDRQNFIATAKQLKLKVGLALDFYTPITELTTEELQAIDSILLMSYKAGHSGPSLNEGIYQKIDELKQRHFNKIIEIDGGVNPSNSSKLLTAGATHLAVNASLWHDGTVKENLQKLLSSCRT